MSCSHFDLLTRSPLEMLEKPADFPWYGIRTKSNQEKVAALALWGKGYQPYLPVYTTSRRRVDRTVVTERPLFPGYLFCRFDPIKRLPILTSTGVMSVLGFGNEPAIIPDLEIEAVKAVLKSGLGVCPYPFLQEGQRVRVVSGSLEGLDGILVRIKNEFRLVVSVKMLQRSVAVEIDRNCVSAA